MSTNERSREAVDLILAALKPLLTERGCPGFSPKSFERLCRFVHADELRQLEATRLVFQQAVPRVASLHARDAPARVSQAMFEPAAVADGLAMYALTADQGEDFATFRAALPRLELHLEATLSAGQSRRF